MGAGDALAVEPGDNGDPAADVGVPYCSAAGVGCGPAEEPGEECDGGMREVDSPP